MKHIFFDFDGVISPFTPYALPEDSITPLTSPHGYDISYINDVVAWIHDLANQKGVRLYWLTTWTNTLHHLAPIGLPDTMINIVPLSYFSVRDGYWKLEAGIDKINQILLNNPDDTVVWIDDDTIVTDGVAGAAVINPDRHVGLTQKEMDYIESL